MRIFTLFVCFTGLLFLNLQCDECEVRERNMTVNVSGQATLNDTIWLAANFPADNGATKIAETGGHMQAYVLRVDTTNLSAGNARNDFDFVATSGAFQTNRPGLDEPTGLYWTYGCPEEDCRFRIGLIPRDTGLFVIQVNGLGYKPAFKDKLCELEVYSIGDVSLNTEGITGLFEWPNDQVSLSFPLTTVNRSAAVSPFRDGVLSLKIVQ